MGLKSCKIESKNAGENIDNELKESTEVNESFDTPLVKKLVSDDKLEKKTLVHTNAKIEFVKAKQQEKSVRKPVKYAEMYRSQDFKEFNGGYVTFGGGGNGGRITEGSEGFHQIMDFLNTGYLKYALIENLTIYVSLLQQFWKTAAANTIDTRELQITATIDRKVKLVSEASIRRHLNLEDSDGISTLPNTEILEQLALIKASKGYTRVDIPLFLTMLVQGSILQGYQTRQETKVPQPSSPTHTHVADEAASTGLDIRHGGATTTVTSLDTGQGSGNIDKTPSMPYDLPLPRVNILGSDEGSMTLQELTDICTAKESVTTAGASMPISTAGMIDKGKGIMEESKSVQTKIKRQQEQERLGLEAAMRLQEQARVEADEELTQKLQAEERDKYSEVDQAKMLVDLINQRKKYFAAKRVKERRKKPMKQAQQRTYMSNNIKHIGSYTLKQLKKLSFDELKELFEATMRSINDFVPMEGKDDKTVPKLAEAKSLKRDAEELKHEGSKKKKTSDASGSAQEQPVEKEYPLSKGILTQMLYAKLMVEKDSEMYRESIRKIFMQATAKAKNINNEAQIHAKVDGKKKKQKPRKSKNKDTQETQPSDPTYESLNKEHVPTQSNDPPFLRVHTLRSGEDSLKLKELMELCTKLSDRVLNLETTKTAQAKKISSLKRRFKRLEKKKKSRTHGLKRLYKVVLSARVESSAEEQIDETVEDQGRFDDQDMFDTWVLDDEEVVVEKAVVVKEVYVAQDQVSDAITTVTKELTVDDITLAKALKALKSLKHKIRGIVIRDHKEPSETTTIPTYIVDNTRPKEFLEKRRKFFAAKRDEEKRNRPLTKAHKRSLMCIYLKNMDGWKPRTLKNKSFAEIKELFDKAMTRINNFVDFRTKLVKESSKKAEESSSKRARDELEQKNTTYYLLVEKMYPLIKYTLTQVWNDVRLQVDYEVEMAYDLLRLVRRQLREGYVPK
uniref:Uncharacterized protein n=1 Tax=Tanacetum cinerariifolium TaxID=118510 RepID=A0A699GSU0_TANCI|nr:hypothetical protein [Tanacetum cinerariifolium]